MESNLYADEVGMRAAFNRLENRWVRLETRANAMGKILQASSFGSLVLAETADDRKRPHGETIKSEELLPQFLIKPLHESNVGSFDSHSGSSPPKLLTVEQLSVELQVPVNTIYYWKSRREIPFLKIGKHLRFDLEQVIEYFNQNQQGHCVPDFSTDIQQLDSEISSLKIEKNGHVDLQKEDDDGNK